MRELNIWWKALGLTVLLFILFCIAVGCGFLIIDLIMNTWPPAMLILFGILAFIVIFSVVMKDLKERLVNEFWQI